MIKLIFTIILGTIVTLISFIFRGWDLAISRNLRPGRSYYRLSFPNHESFMGETLADLHDNWMMAWLVGILILVALVMARCYWNQTTSKNFISNFSVEFRWIFLPSFVLLGIGIPSVDFLYKIEEGEKDSLISLKSFGYQWYWTYEINRADLSSEFSSRERYIRGEEDAQTYLSSDVTIQIPNFTPILNIITASDVIHRWALPSIIIKADAIPGRINSLSFEFSSLNSMKHYGQCSELCGANHRFIPIVVEVL